MGSGVSASQESPADAPSFPKGSKLGSRPFEKPKQSGVSRNVSRSPVAREALAAWLLLLGDLSALGTSLQNSTQDHVGLLSQMFVAATVIGYCSASPALAATILEMGFSLASLTSVQLADACVVLSLARGADPEAGVHSATAIKAVRWVRRHLVVHCLEISYSPLISSFWKSKIPRESEEAVPLSLYVVMHFGRRILMHDCTDSAVLLSQAHRERVEQGVWAVYHLSGLLMPADILTKAMTASKFGEMLPLLGVTVPAEDNRARIVALLACCALLLKGQSSPEPEGWGWVIGYLVVVILAYEGLRSCFRRFLGVAAVCFPGFGARLPESLDVHSSPHPGTTQPPQTSGARLPRGSSLSTIDPSTGASSILSQPQPVARVDPPSRSSKPSLRSIGVNTNPEVFVPPPPPPILPAAPAAVYRHPTDLVSHHTTNGSHWHQNPECYHLRNREHSSLLPCSDCVVGRTVFHSNLPTGLRRRRGR